MFKRTLLLLCSGVWGWVIGETCEIIHTGIKRNGEFAALLEGEIPLAALDFGIIALVNSCQHLDFNLCKTFCFAQFFQPAHFITQEYYGNFPY